MFAPLRKLLERTVRTGNLTVIDAQGNTARFGDGTGKAVTVRLLDRRLEWELAIDPMLRLGEAYMDGRLRMESGRIYDLLDVTLQNLKGRNWPRIFTLLNGARYLTRRVQQFNPIFRAKRNAQRHYDVDDAIYALFLDADRQYSCAYFETGEEDIDTAQLAKKRHIAAKLYLKDGQKILDIGSGWGGLGLYLAQLADVRVKGITLSNNQYAYARKRAKAVGLDDKVSFALEDYRQLKGTFDRIVSVGMFEHVGVGHYDTFFQVVADRLADDGVALLHTIGRADVPAVTNPFIAKYIFPGGYIPAMSEILPAIERAGLMVTDIEVLRLHYAETLRRWRERFLARWDDAVRLKGERFCRMWEFYLAGSETAFRHENLVVFQIQMVKDQEALPLTRDYLFETEDAYRRKDIPSSAYRLAGE